jgi:carboxypeptidase PM20D1
MSPLILALALLAVLVLVLVIRAGLFRPLPEALPVANTRHHDGPAIAGRLAEMIRLETVSNHDPALTDFGKFDEFKALLPRLYPRVHAVCERSLHGTTGILYRWPGKGAGPATVLMSHYDVVPADASLWSRPPFAGVVENGELWGRGTLDTKGTLCAVLEAAESLLDEGFTPQGDVWLSFSGDEEVSGPSAPAIVAHLASLAVRPALVLDEGGAIVSGLLPGVSKPMALVGVGEKGYLDLDLTMSGPGGHSSTPPAHSLAGQLARAVVRLEARPFPVHLTAPVREMLETLGRHAGFGLRLVFGNLWLFAPLLKLLLPRFGRETNALVRTTQAVTRMEGSRAYNVLPPRATVGVNLRLLQTDTVETARSRVEKVLGNPDIGVQVVEAREASPVSSTTGEGWRKLRQAVLATWRNVAFSPYLMFAATDSRHFCSISDSVYRFSAMPLTRDDMKLIHGHDERIRIADLVDTVRFYETLLLSL